MATVIAAEKFRAGGYGVRASVNNHVFVEAEIMRAGARAIDGKVGTGAETIVIDAWYPPAEAEDVDHGHSVLIDLHAVGTNPLEALWDEGTDFDAGTFNDVEVVGDQLNLTTTPYVEDWEAGPSAEDNWTSRFTHGEYGSVIDDGSGSNYVYSDIHWNDEILYTADDGPVASDVIVKTRWQIKNKDDAKICLAARITGTGASTRGYILAYVEDTNVLSLRRIIGDGTTYQEGWDNTLPISEVQQDQWCHMAYKVTATGHYYKIWMEPDAEPGSWTWIATNGTHPGPGAVGIMTIHTSGNELIWWDDFEAETVPPLYQTTGDWVSDPIDVTAVGNYSYGILTWDETTPTDTTVAVKARWRWWDAWAAVTNGGELPAIDRGKAMVAGTPYDDLELQVVLSTTDTGATPAVENFRLYFEPVAPEALVVDLGGDYTCTVANGLLEYYHRNHVVGAATVHDWDDIKITTKVKRWYIGPGAEPSIAVKYGGVTMDSIVWHMARDTWLETTALIGLYWGMVPLVYTSAPIQVRWNARHDWAQMGHVYEWVLIDKNLAMHADVGWLCGHYQIDDIPGSLVAAALELGDHPGFLIAEGHKLNDHHGSLLAQAWQRDDIPGMVMPSVETLSDHVGFLVVAVQQHSDHPGSFLVRGVNSDGTIETSIVDAAVWTELAARGYTRG